MRGAAVNGTASATRVLRIEALSKRFGSTQAVDDVSLDLHAGEILALLGESGAGKSTLIKILAGVYSKDSGSVALHGRPEAEWRAAPREQQGMAFIHHQDLGLVERMTVAENVALGMGSAPARADRLKAGRAERAPRPQACRLRHRSAAARLHANARREVAARNRPRLDADARMLVLDEPTANLPTADVQRMFALLRQLRGRGVATIYISHLLDEILDIFGSSGGHARRKAGRHSHRGASERRGPGGADPMALQAASGPRRATGEGNGVLAGFSF